MDDRRTHYEFTAQLWEWSSRTSWFFLSVPPEDSAQIEDQPRPPRGFGSVRVRVRVGQSVWETSIFPSSGNSSLVSPAREAGTRAQAPAVPVREYVLPIKKTIRQKEGIDVGSRVAVVVELLE